MSALFDFHGIAPAAVEGMAYSLIEGTILALLIYLVLRLVPRKNSGTRFAVWFSTLLAVAILPFLTLPSLRAGAVVSATGSASRHGLFTLPASWAAWAFLVWAVIALAGLLSVAVGFWQVLRLRKSCVPIDPKILDPEVQEIVERFQQSRPVLIGTSSKLDVPTAVGFRNPAVLLPSWLVDEVSATELKHVLLHELAHLRRRDDWTNLVQKLVKALMFFHPLVWWIERRLSLEREIACDDAVLVQTDSPRIYAQCLARVAEKSFLRRQIALAQAAVSRMHQLSARVAQILDLERPRTTQLWKPAIPLVGAFALLCGLSLRQAPALVSFAEERPTGPIATTVATVNTAPTATRPALAYNESHSVVAEGMGVQLINAGFKPAGDRQRSVPTQAVKHRQQPHAVVERTQASHPAAMQLASYSEYVVAHEEFVVTMTSQSSQPGQWQVQVWQLRVLVPASQAEKVTPRKT
jgi:beta-lactamase regulating signal transducer with metallopeptidase domain